MEARLFKAFNDVRTLEKDKIKIAENMKEGRRVRSEMRSREPRMSICFKHLTAKDSMNSIKRPASVEPMA